MYAFFIMKPLLLSIILLIAQNDSELTKKQGLEIYREAEKIIESNLPVEMQLRRVVYKRHIWNTSQEHKYKTLNQINEFFKGRNYDNYDLHLAILSQHRDEPRYAIFKGLHYCLNSTGLVTANRNYFAAYLGAFAVTLAHEIGHLIGAAHDKVPGSVMSELWSRVENPFFSDMSKGQINACLAKW